MPAIHYEIFKARYYECDPFGCLKNINYLRWMQEAAFAASAAVGYDFYSYNQIGQLWLVRETEIEYLVPIKYGVEVEIKTWVKDFRRFRSKRAYEIRGKSSGQLVARAVTDWVYLDSGTFKPVPIPGEMGLAFFPEGLPQDVIRRGRFPKAPTPPDNPFSFRRIVSWYDIDLMWHVNNATYLNYIDEADVFLCEASGWSMQRMYLEGLKRYSKSHHIEYHQPARYGDILEISTWHSDIKEETAIMHYEIRRVEDRDLLLRARSHWGFSDTETGEQRPIPLEFLGAISQK